MTTVPFYQVDAFTTKAFSGNPAAVCLLESWPDDQLLLKIAAENNLAETAFLVPADKEHEAVDYQLRWFTPTVEVELCGHATLASAWVLWFERGFPGDVLTFSTQSGELIARRLGERIQLDFPARHSLTAAVPQELELALGFMPDELLVGHASGVVDNANRIVRAASADFIANYQPNFQKMAELSYGIILTAPAGNKNTDTLLAENCDFVSRYFAVPFGISEDPVTGSAHCDLMPYWVSKLGKSKLHAQQLSHRGGTIDCELLGDRVLLTGDAVVVIQGHLRLC